MPKKLYSNGNRRPIRYENWNGAIVIQYDGNIVLNNGPKVYDASNENEEHFEERRVLPTFENTTSHSAFVPSPSSTILTVKLQFPMN